MIQRSHQYNFTPLISLAFIAMGSSYFMTFISVNLGMRDIPETLIGLIHSAYYAGLIVGALTVERQILKVGYIRSFAAYAAVTCATILTQAIFYEPVTWIPLRFAAGYSLAALYVTIEGWLLASSTAETRGQVLAMYMVFLYSAQTIVQYFIELFPDTSALPFVFAALLTSMGSVPVLLSERGAPQITEAPQIKLNTLIKQAPLGLFGCVISGIGISAIYAFGPFYAEYASLSVSGVMSALIFGGMLLQFVVGKVSDLFDRRKVLTLICALLLFPTLLTILFHHSYIAILACFLIGGLVFTLYPVSVSIVVDSIDQTSILSATSMALLCYGVGSVIGPMLASFSVTLMGAGTLFPLITLCALLLAAACATTVVRDKRKAKVVVEEQGEFIALPRTSHVANELDPRLDDEEPMDAS